MLNCFPKEQRIFADDHSSGQPLAYQCHPTFFSTKARKLDLAPYDVRTVNPLNATENEVPYGTMQEPNAESEDTQPVGPLAGWSRACDSVLSCRVSAELRDDVTDGRTESAREPVLCCGNLALLYARESPRGSRLESRARYATPPIVKLLPVRHFQFTSNKRDERLSLRGDDTRRILKYFEPTTTTTTAGYIALF